jgi:hypothetical protein
LTTYGLTRTLRTAGLGDSSGGRQVNGRRTSGLTVACVLIAATMVVPDVAGAETVIVRNEPASGGVIRQSYCYDNDWIDSQGHSAGAIGFVLKIKPTDGYTTQRIAYKVQYNYRTSVLTGARQTVNLTGWRYKTIHNGRRRKVDLKFRIPWAYSDSGHHIIYRVKWKVNGTWRFKEFWDLSRFQEWTSAPQIFWQVEDGTSVGYSTSCVA